MPEINVAKEVTQKKILEEVNMIAAFTADIAKGYPLDSWEAYNEYVKNEVSKKVFEVGDTITITYTATNGTEYDMDWVIAGFKDKTINGRTYKDVPILTTPYCTLESIPFAPEERLYATEEGLPAGTYYFEIKEKYQGWNVGDHVQFTLTQDLPAGGQISSNLKALTDPAVQVYTYESCNTTTKLETVVPVEGTTGTKLGDVYATKENGNCNSMQRVWYGNGSYLQSLQREWANADAVKDTWWQPCNKWQVKNNAAANFNGFLYGLPEDFKRIVLPTTVRTAYNNFEAAELEETFYETQDKFWLLSKEEVCGVPNVTGEHEGTALEYWIERTDLDAPSDGACATRICYAMENHQSASYARLRSAFRANAYHAWLVNYSTGQLDYSSGYLASRALLACQPINPSI